jgi:hypothetical protein
MLMWESTDSTVRLLSVRASRVARSSSAFQKAPSIAAIPCTFNDGDPVQRRAAVQDVGRWAEPCLTLDFFNESSSSTSRSG